MTETTKKRRSLTAVRRSKIVKDAVIEMDLEVDDSIGTLIEKLRDAALAEVESK